MLEEELQTLRHELKSAWQVLGYTNKLISLQELRQVRQDNKLVVESIANGKAGNTVPTIIMITPTYTRWTQKADLTRLCHTLMHVDDLLWIVVEDSNNKTDSIEKLLVKCKVNYVHLNIRTARDLQLEVMSLYTDVNHCIIV